MEDFESQQEPTVARRREATRPIKCIIDGQPVNATLTYKETCGLDEDSLRIYAANDRVLLSSKIDATPTQGNCMFGLVCDEAAEWTYEGRANAYSVLIYTLRAGGVVATKETITFCFPPESSYDVESAKQ